jgi:hypothetical protein
MAPVDTTVIPPPGTVHGAMRPWSLPSLGSALAAGPFCPECDRDLSVDPDPGAIVLCETCVDVAAPPVIDRH